MWVAFLGMATAVQLLEQLYLALLAYEAGDSSERAKALSLVCYKGTRGFHGVIDVMVSCLCIQCFRFDLMVHLTGTVAEGAPVIPVSAQLKYNIDVICEYITKRIPVPVRDFSSAPRLIGKDFTCPLPAPVEGFWSFWN